MQTVAQLNKLLERELGTNPYGEAIFRWEFSEDLYWPEFATGRMVEKPVKIPIIGGSVECEECRGKGEKLVWDDDESWYEQCTKCDKGRIYGTEMTASISVPEYRKEKMAPNLDRQWVVTVWTPPESLPQWQAMFPGAPYPARGHRIHTNASLPSYPGGPREPNLSDTQRFIELLHFQRSHTHREAEHAIDDERTARDKSVQKEIEDEILSDMPAFMNIDPGKRGGYVSFPYSKKDTVQ